MRLKRVTYDCKNPKCDLVISVAPSQVGHKRYCTSECRTNHREEIKRERMNDFIISKCKYCSSKIKSKRQPCGKLIPRKQCDSCWLKMQRKKATNMTKIESEKYKSDPVYRKQQIEQKRQAGLKMKERGHSEKTKKHLSKVHKDKFKNDPVYREQRRQRWIEYLKSKNGQLFPNYNPHACKVIDEYGKEHGFNFQHAENGGEFHIKELGYWVDGYDKEQNVVISYLEKHHRRQKEKDEHRKNEIIDFLGCRFIEIKEWEMD